MYYDMKESLDAMIAEQEKMEATLERQLSKSVKGSIVVSRCRADTQYYKYIGDNRKKYLSKRSQTDTIEKLCQKKYQEVLLKMIHTNLTILRKMKREYNRVADLSDAFAGLPPEIQKYAVPVVLSDAEFVKEWMSDSRFPLEAYPEEKILMTKRGERVRSKSEQLLANMFYDLGIPYKYEYPFYVGYVTYYPDFILLDIKNRKEVVFEHFGRMDDLEYVGKSIRKLYDYEKAGLVWGDTLLCSFEDGENVFQLEYFRKSVQQRFGLTE